MPSFDFPALPALLISVVAAFAAAMVRGFSGFGSGLIFMPLAAACLGPRLAVGVLFVIDSILIIPYALAATQRIEWREILPLAAGALLTVPAGVFVLLHVDPVPLRWGLSISILLSVAALALGWRYRGRTRIWLSMLVGGVAGFMSGSA